MESGSETGRAMQEAVLGCSSLEGESSAAEPTLGIKVGWRESGEEEGEGKKPAGRGESEREKAISSLSRPPAASPSPSSSPLPQARRLPRYRCVTASRGDCPTRRPPPGSHAPRGRPRRQPAPRARCRRQSRGWCVVTQSRKGVGGDIFFLSNMHLSSSLSISQTEPQKARAHRRSQQ